MEISLAARSSPEAGLLSAGLLQSRSALIGIPIYEIVYRFKELIRLFRFVVGSLPCCQRASFGSISASFFRGSSSLCSSTFLFLLFLLVLSRCTLSVFNVIVNFCVFLLDAFDQSFETFVVLLSKNKSGKVLPVLSRGRILLFGSFHPLYFVLGVFIKFHKHVSFENWLFVLRVCLQIVFVFSFSLLICCFVMLLPKRK